MVERKPVQMAREMHSRAYTEEERKLARASVEESVNRMFPGYVYKGESVSTNGKLVAINFVYVYSRWQAWKHRAVRYLQSLWS